jgi:phosphoglycerol transferase MdoB-like AlkP superfamily enzyme
LEIHKLGFSFLSNLVQIEIWVFLVGLMSSIFFLIIKNKINVRGLLFEKGGNKLYSPQRLQVLLLSLIFVVVYLIEVRQNINLCQASNVPCSLPEIRSEYLLILGGSNFVYIWGKFSSIIKERRSQRA